MKMKQMPFKVEYGAIERAKYRAKLAVREVAHPADTLSHKREWRWAGAIAVAAIVVVGAIGLVKYHDDIFRTKTPMEELFSDMQDAPDDIIKEWARDAGYYLEDINSL